MLTWTFMHHHLGHVCCCQPRTTCRRICLQISACEFLPSDDICPLAAPPPDHIVIPPSCVAPARASVLGRWTTPSLRAKWCCLNAVHATEPIAFFKCLLALFKWSGWDAFHADAFTSRARKRGSCNTSNRRALAHVPNQHHSNSLIYSFTNLTIRIVLFKIEKIN